MSAHRPLISQQYPLLIAVICLGSSTAAATRVEIVIDEPIADRQVAFPLTTGIPFPRGGLTDQSHCQLLDDRGTRHPFQTRVAATWDAEQKSIRWLTIDFIAQPDRKYWLEFGDTVRPRDFSTPLKVEGNGNVSVSTGILRAEFSMTAGSALQTLSVDLNANGVVEANETVLTGREGGDHYYTDQNGDRFSSAFDKADREIVVETKGPIRACIRVDGFYTGPDGKRVVAYRTRYHFFANLGLIKVVDEFRVRGSTTAMRFHDIGFGLQLVGRGKNRRVIVDRSGDAGNQVLSAKWKPGTKSIKSAQITYRHFGNPECGGTIVETNSEGERELSTSDHVGEWIQVCNDRAAITGSLRGMWQQFPKEWEVTDDQLTLHLWSPRAKPLDFGADGLREVFGEAGDKYILGWKGVSGTLSPISNFFYFAGHHALTHSEIDGRGINKHHEFYFHVGAANQAETGQQYGQLAARPPLALATGKWNCSTDVFGPLSPRPNDSQYEAIVDRLFDLGRKAQDDFGDYGWWIYGSGPHYSYQWDKETGKHYADPRRFEYHTYQKETQLWWNYLRSGERKFYDWAFPSEDHWVDIATTHVPLNYESAWRGGFRQRQTLQMRPGDWSIDTAMFYVRQRDSAEAWLRGGSQFWASYHRTLETTSLAYYLTGDERYNDVIQFWADYWRDLAGKTSASTDVKPWHREQAWFVSTKPDEPTKTWAEMIRDYAPFTSGLRHQMTQFFNLATLYEHTWDPQLGQLLGECADAYLDPEHRIGVWRTQENGLPNHADAPELAHFWVPALWKYARATQDPRMKDVFQRYFLASYASDPFRENVGRYSNVHIGYAYYYTRDPRHLRPALLELESLMLNAEPLARPEDLGQRLYNPYAPIKCFTAVPRLTWALTQAKQNGVKVLPPAPLKPQRTAIAFHKQAGQALQLTLWGYDRNLALIGPDAKPFHGAEVKTDQHASDIQPFDRNLRRFEVYLHTLTIPAKASAGYYIITPQLELAVLRVGSADESPSSLLVNAARPVSLEPSETCRFVLPEGGMPLQFETAVPSSLEVRDADGDSLKTTSIGNQVSLAMDITVGTVLELRNSGPRKLWFRMPNREVGKCWVTFGSEWPLSLPSDPQSKAALPVIQTGASDKIFAAGRFGQSVQIVPGRQFSIPDHVEMDGKQVNLFDMQQGTIEFWIKKQWDDRLVTTQPVTFLTNGPLQAWSPWKLPLGEWAHVAVEWRPLKRDPSRLAVHIYVDGHDQQNYRSTWWEGYSQKPITFRGNQEWLKQFLCMTQPGAPFRIDELRISSVPRYAKTDVMLGGQQTFNPARFDSPTRPFVKDQQTLLLMHFDDDFAGESSRVPVKLEGQIADQ